MLELGTEYPRWAESRFEESKAAEPGARILSLTNTGLTSGLVLAVQWRAGRDTTLPRWGLGAKRRRVTRLNAKSEFEALRSCAARSAVSNNAKHGRG